jgi:hypothetical protein
MASCLPKAVSVCACDGLMPRLRATYAQSATSLLEILLAAATAAADGWAERAEWIDDLLRVRRPFCATNKRRSVRRMRACAPRTHWSRHLLCPDVCDHAIATCRVGASLMRRCIAGAARAAGGTRRREWNSSLATAAGLWRRVVLAAAVCKRGRERRCWRWGCSRLPARSLIAARLLAEQNSAWTSMNRRCTDSN